MVDSDLIRVCDLYVKTNLKDSELKEDLEKVG